jgi:putative zinc finger/helix-turn-helix YgiT family protein
MERNVNEARPKRFPIRCIECGQQAVYPTTITKNILKKHDGRPYEITVNEMPVTACHACGHVYFSAASDDQINAALRDKLALLSPLQIKANIEALGISQREAARRLGVAAETLSRWISGAIIQSRAMDNLLRAFFACPDLREKLQGRETDKQLGAVAIESTNTPNSRRPSPRFPRLERRGEVEQCNKLAGAIRRRHSVFALA